MRVTQIIADLHVPALEAGADFYTDYLGLSEEEFNLGWVARHTSPATGAHLQRMTRDATAPQDPVISVKVDDVDAAYLQAQERGYAIVHPLTTEEWGVRRFFVRAPDGNIVNLVQDHLHTPGRAAGDGRGAGPTSEVVVPEHEDPRTAGPMTGDERAVLDRWLESYRESVFLKIAGLDAEQLTRRALPPSSMSLIGVVRHLTEVEAYWLRVVLLDERDVPDHYCTRASRDGDFDDIDPATVVADVEAYRRELRTTRVNAAAWTDLTEPVRGVRRGEPVNLRWILTHLIEEYARHLGHMDLLRETIDGRTGY